MLRLIISLLVAGLITGGVYYFLIYDNPTQPAGQQNTTNPSSSTSDTLDAANGAVQQTQNLQDRINQQTQKQTSN